MRPNDVNSPQTELSPSEKNGGGQMCGPGREPCRLRCFGWALRLHFYLARFEREATPPVIETTAIHTFELY